MTNFQGQGQLQEFSDEDRDKMFWSKVAIKNWSDCWEYMEFKFPQGYGQFWNGIRRMGAHVFAYESHYKCKIPKGKSVLHKCDNPSCCNPLHLYIGTQLDNMQDRSLRCRDLPEKLSFGRAAFSAEKILAIRKALRTTKTKESIARAYGVGIDTVYRIRRTAKFACREGYYV